MVTRFSYWVSFYIAEDLTYVCLEEISFADHEIEYISVKVRFTNVNKIVVNIYRLPGTNSNIILEKFECILRKCRETYRSCALYVIGDFNIDLLKVSDNTAVQFFFSNLMFSYPVIRRPTRITFTSYTDK